MTRDDLTLGIPIPKLSQPDPKGDQPADKRKVTMSPDINVMPRKRRPDQEHIDKQAWELHGTLGTWSAVAKALGYANGSIARRAGYRYARGAGLVVDVPESPIEN